MDNKKNQRPDKQLTVLLKMTFEKISAIVLDGLSEVSQKQDLIMILFCYNT
jgi:hypothetical protein